MDIIIVHLTPAQASHEIKKVANTVNEKMEIKNRIRILHDLSINIYVQVRSSSNL